MTSIKIQPYKNVAWHLALDVACSSLSSPEVRSQFSTHSGPHIMPIEQLVDGGVLWLLSSDVPNSVPRRMPRRLMRLKDSFVYIERHMPRHDQVEVFS